MQRNVSMQSRKRRRVSHAFRRTEGRIRFVEDPTGSLGAIWVSVHASQLHSVYRTLSRLGVQVTQIHLERQAQSIAYVLDVTELNGSRIGPKRWLSVQPKLVQCVLSLTARKPPILSYWAS